MKTIFLLPLVLLGAHSAQAVDYTTQILPILKDQCYKCHSLEAKKTKGDLALDDVKKFGAEIGAGKMIQPGDAENSDFFKSLISDVDSDGHMPPKKMLAKDQVQLIKQWIAEGAKMDGGAAPVVAGAGMMAGEDSAMTGMAGTAPAAPGAPAAAAPAAVAQETTWTSADGRTIQATFIELKGDAVVLRRNDGQTFTVPLARLSPESQNMARSGGAQ